MPLNIDWQQILLHMFNFIILAAGLTFLLFKPIKKFMNARAEKYRQAADDYAKAVDQTQLLEKERQVKIATLDGELAERERNAAAVAEHAKKRILAEAEEQADKIIVNGRRHAEMERRHYMAEAGDEMVTLILHSAEKLLAAQSNAQTDSMLYDAYLNLAESDGGVSERSRRAVQAAAERLKKTEGNAVFDKSDVADVMAGAAESAIRAKGAAGNMAVYDEFLKEVNNIDG